MIAHIARFDELNLPRIVQLIAKTNQFNLTTRRHDVSAVRRIMGDERYVHLYLRLEDNLADHGLVALLIAARDGHTLEIDTWLMSCRVIGRTVENALARKCVPARPRTRLLDLARDLRPEPEELDCRRRVSATRVRARVGGRRHNRLGVRRRIERRHREPLRCRERWKPP